MTSPSSPYASDDSLSRFIAAHYPTGGAKHANAADKRKTDVNDDSQPKCAKCGTAGCTPKTCQITPCKTCAAVIGAPAAGYCKASTRAGKEPGYIAPRRSTRHRQRERCAGVTGSRCLTT